MKSAHRIITHFQGTKDVEVPWRDTCYIHQPPQTSRPCPPKFPLQWPVSNMTNSRIIWHPDLPRTIPIYAGLDNHSCGQPPIWSGFTLHHLSCYLPSIHTGLLSTPQNTVYLPTSGHLHGSSLYNIFPLFPSTFFYWLLFILQSHLKYHLLGEVSCPPPRQEWYTPRYTLLYISSIKLIMNVALHISVNSIRLEAPFLVWIISIPLVSNTRPAPR